MKVRFLRAWALPVMVAAIMGLVVGFPETTAAQALICCNLTLNVGGNWIGSSRKCPEEMEKSLRIRHLVCQELPHYMSQSELRTNCKEIADLCATERQDLEKLRDLEEELRCRVASLAGECFAKASENLSRIFQQQFMRELSSNQERRAANATQEFEDFLNRMNTDLKEKCMTLKEFDAKGLAYDVLSNPDLISAWRYYSKPCFEKAQRQVNKERQQNSRKQE